MVILGEWIQDGLVKLIKLKVICLTHMKPVLYLIDKKYRKGERHTYTRNQLQVVSKDEQ